MVLGHEPRQTTSNLGHLNKPSIQVTHDTWHLSPPFVWFWNIPHIWTTNFVYYALFVLAWLICVLLSKIQMGFNYNILVENCIFWMGFVFLYMHVLFMCLTLCFLFFRLWFTDSTDTITLSPSITGRTSWSKRFKPFLFWKISFFVAVLIQYSWLVTLLDAVELA